MSLKYKYATEIGRELSNHLVKSLQSMVLPGVVYLTPIPIHWYRQNTRGFNQSLEVGKIVAGLMNWKLIPDLLVKNMSTIPQAELSGKKRRKNLKGVFSLNPEVAIPDSVFVFDDVFTTGSTMLEAGKVLKRAGVRKVWGLTIAR